MNYIFSLLLITAFSSQTEADTSVLSQEEDDLIEIIKCKKDTSYSYALYLPSYYTKDKKWPVLFALDPAARGQLPVKTFKDAAEKYGYIVIGSNNSRNGPWEPIFTAINHLFEDAFQRFSIDPKRVYVTGFSGGARSASAIAVITSRVTGVIACGAGFAPKWPPEANLNFHYLGIIGNQDFNYLEMHQTKDKLEENKIRNQLLIFEGGHRWPPQAYTYSALEWLQINAMRNKLIPIDEKFTNSILEEKRQQIAKLKGKKEYYKVYILYKKLVDDFNGLVDVSEYEKHAALLEQSDEIKEFVKQKNKIVEREAQLQRRYYAAFQKIHTTVFSHLETETKTKAWWRNEMDSINNLIDNSESNEEILLGKRLNDFLWRTTYINYKNYMNTNDFAQALQFLEIWKIVQPEQPVANYLSARVYVKTNNYRKALSELESAVGKGFTDIKLLKQDTILNQLKRMKRYQKVISEMGKNEK